MDNETAELVLWAAGLAEDDLFTDDFDDSASGIDPRDKVELLSPEFALRNKLRVKLWNAAHTQDEEADIPY